MTGSIVFTSYLTFAPPPPRVDLGARLDHSRVIAGEDELRLIAYDHDGQVVGTITLWVEPHGLTGVYCDYGDGYAVILITPNGEVRTDASLPREVVVERADLIASHVEPYGPPEGAAWSCPFTAIVAACECLPQRHPRRKDRSC